MNSPSHPPTFAGQPPSFGVQQPVPNSAPSGLPSLLSPPESRRMSGDEKDTRQPSRQSLPSIREALQPDTYPAPPPLPPPPTSNRPVYSQPRPKSPPPPPSRSFSSDHSAPPPPVNSHGHPPEGPYMGQPSNGTSAPHRPLIQTDGMSRAPQNPKFPSLNPLRTAQSPTNSHSHYPPPQQQQQQHLPPPPQPYDVSPASSTPSNSQMGGYSQFSSINRSYTSPTQPAPTSAYQPGGAYPAAQPRYASGSGWQANNADLAKVDELKRTTGRVIGPAYGESVKRHLDNFDFDASLNEITDGTGRISDFTKRFSHRAHQTQRSGNLQESLPTVAEVDEMMKQNQRVRDSLLRIREVVIAQKAAVPEQARESGYKATNGAGYEQEESGNGFHEHGKGGGGTGGAGGFAGPDPKKRRGVSSTAAHAGGPPLPPATTPRFRAAADVVKRAAPPGRCHSCNRAETPEWRRGPDGARTLCNACGLHYAKLTRKMGANKVPLASSHLRPKSMGPGSPQS